MGLHLRTFLRRTWIGLAGVLLSLAAALAITTIWGPLWGEFGWRFVAGGIGGHARGTGGEGLAGTPGQ